MRPSAAETATTATPVGSGNRAFGGYSTTVRTTKESRHASLARAAKRSGEKTGLTRRAKRRTACASAVKAMTHTTRETFAHSSPHFGSTWWRWKTSYDARAKPTTTVARAVAAERPDARRRRPGREGGLLGVRVMGESSGVSDSAPNRGRQRRAARSDASPLHAGLGPRVELAGSRGEGWRPG